MKIRIMIIRLAFSRNALFLMGLLAINICCMEHKTNTIKECLIKKFLGHFDHITRASEALAQGAHPHTLYYEKLSEYTQALQQGDHTPNNIGRISSSLYLRYDDFIECACTHAHNERQG